ncbi:MFS transporter [Rhizobium leguminosarum]|uniref:MFS transporter n=1 Tax=Rhizobium leguminosarum TaxID=384 RepID=UPI001C94E9DC|nr:MFS transporter [Rhizobium leguminosarum]MBY5904255.1 MFS transporter [Rhizobium leguminosarum]MBY5911624.1 MFS transporter [Rhizobium leguminosarum]
MHNDRKQFFVLALAFLMSMFFRSYFGVVGPMVAADIDLDPSRYGYAASAFFISFGLLQMPLGSAFDRFGARTPITVSMIVGSMGAALVAMAGTAGQLVAGQAVLGAGCAPIFMGVVYQFGSLGDGVVARKKIAAISAVGSLGALLSASPMVWLSETLGWRGAMLVAASAMALCAAGVAFRMGPPPQEGQSEDAPESSPAGIVYLLPICLTLSLGGTFRNAWATPYLSGVFSADQRLSGFALTIVSAVGIGTSFAIPALVSRVSPRSIVTAGMAAATIAAFAMAVSPGSSIVAAIALICLLYSIGNLHPLVMAEAQEIAPSKHRGLLLGFLNTVVFFGVAISSAIFGWIAQIAGGPSATFQIILFSTAGCLAIGLTVYLTRPAWRSVANQR